MNGKKKNTNALFNTLDNENGVTDAFARRKHTIATNPKDSCELHCKKDFEGNENQSMLLSATCNSFTKDQVSHFTNTTTIVAAANMQQRALQILDKQIIFLRQIIPTFGQIHIL